MSIKALGFKTSIVSNLVFANITILLCFVLFFLIIELYSLILAVIERTFNPTPELAIPTGTPTNEANPETETQPLTAEMKIRKCSK